MTPNERRAASMEFVQRSEQEFDLGGNTMIAAELLWGAVAQCLIAIANTNGWECKGHSGYFQVAKRLAEQHNDPSWRSDAAAADELHSHFYNRHLQPAQMQSRRVAAKRLIHRSINLLTAR